MVDVVKNFPRLRNWSLAQCALALMAGGSWTPISDSVGLGGLGSAADVELLRVPSFPFFLGGMFRRSASARPVGDVAISCFFSLLAKP